MEYITWYRNQNFDHARGKDGVALAAAQGTDARRRCYEAVRFKKACQPGSNRRIAAAMRPGDTLLIEPFGNLDLSIRRT